MSPINLHKSNWNQDQKQLLHSYFILTKVFVGHRTSQGGWLAIVVLGRIKSLYQITVRSNEQTTVDINMEVVRIWFRFPGWSKKTFFHVSLCNLRNQINSKLCSNNSKRFMKYFHQKPTMILIIKSRCLVFIWNAVVTNLDIACEFLLHYQNIAKTTLGTSPYSFQKLCLNF